MVNALTSMSRRELDRTIDRYPWFTSARRARELVTGGSDEALALPMLFWPTVAPDSALVHATAPDSASAPAPASASTAAEVPAVASEETLARVNVLADAPAAAEPNDCAAVSSDAPNTPDVRPAPADELIDRFISRGGYRIAPDGEAADARVDVEIAPEMVTPQLAAIYRSQGLVAEAEKVERILNCK